MSERYYTMSNKQLLEYRVRELEALIKTYQEEIIKIKRELTAMEDINK